MITVARATHSKYMHLCCDSKDHAANSFIFASESSSCSGCSVGES